MDRHIPALPQNALADQHEQFHRAFEVLQAGIEQRAFPGASVAVLCQGKLIALHGLGHFTYDSDPSPVMPETIYDLASLTKVVATTTLCIILFERGVLRLEQKVVEVVPEFATDDRRREAITFQMLLAHSSGLPAHVKLYESAHNKEELERQALKVPLTTDPGSRAEYSDIGFIVLGIALERLIGEPLDQFCHLEIFARLGLDRMTFNPPAHWQSSIPPTGNEQTFRRHAIQAEVNDDNAWVMGGVAAHAGVFATAHDVSVFTHCMLSGGAPLVSPETIKLFTQRQSSPSRTSHALGWDTPSQPSQSGHHFSPSSYGHLGYTGTSLWIDPERQLSVTLLTNRTWPDCQSQVIRQIRPAFHDAILEALR